MMDLVEVIAGELEKIDGLIQDLHGFLSRVGYCGKNTDRRYIRRSIKSIQKEYGDIIDKIWGIADVVPHISSVGWAYEEAVGLESMNPQDRIQAAQEALGYLGPFDECEIEDSELVS